MKMQTYKNLDGNSSVRAFLIGDKYIDVEFNSGRIYRYSYGSAGIANVEQMKRMAVEGRGLNSFIMRNVRDKYEH